MTGTGPDGSVAMSSANRLEGTLEVTGFASRYRLQPRAGFFKGPVGRCKVPTPSSFSLTSNVINTSNLLLS